MAEVEVPSYFLCPISLETMRDPVTLQTGITYDRQSIERWIFTDKHQVCPVTKQSLPSNADLIPNHTLRRLIQAWCTVNAANGVERFPTPKPPVDKSQISVLIDQAKSSPSDHQLNCLKKLKLIVTESERNRRCFIEVDGALDFLAAVITRGGRMDQEEFPDSAVFIAGEEAVGILYALQISNQDVLVDQVSRNNDLIECLVKTMQRSNYQSRIQATLLIKSIVGAVSPARLMALNEEFFKEVTNVLNDRMTHRATKSAIKIVVGACAWGRNRLKAIESGAVAALIELLIDEQETRVCEMALIALDLLCACAEGRAELVAHGAGVAAVSKKIFRVSRVAGERAVRILHSLAKFTAAPPVLAEMAQVGAVAKLCMLLQFDCGERTRERVKEILRMHSRVWKNSPCISPQMQASYP